MDQIAKMLGVSQRTIHEDLISLSIPINSDRTSGTRSPEFVQMHKLKIASLRAVAGDCSKWNN
jgi:hypothetical protein